MWIEKGARNQMNILDILNKHAAWLRSEPEGVKADLNLGISFGSAVSCLITFIALMKKRNQGSGRERNIKSLANTDFGNIAAPFNFSYSLNHQQDSEKSD